MKRLLSLLLAFSPLCAALADGPRKVEGRTPMEWSVWLAESEVARRGSSLEWAEGRKSRWDYTSGILSYSLLRLADETGRKDLGEAGARIVTSFIAEDGTIRTYKQEDYNIDMVTPGRALLYVYERNQETRYRMALQRLRDQLEKHPRTSEGGFWHKLRYPHQMWLDGLYMASPFYVRYGTVFGEPAAYDDVAKQILLIDKHLYDAKTGLYYHGWDEKRAQTWADPKTGLSPSFWGRALGWYAMAVVDAMDEFPPTHPEVDHLNEVLRKIADGIVRWQDPASGVWYQVLDQGAREGNYLEASASAMFVYTLAKGINRGYLPRDTYLPALEKAYAGVIKQFMRPNASGQVDLTRVVEVSGLGFTTATGRARDGTYEYYLSEPIISNDLKGVGPMILAGIEMNHLYDGKKAANVLAPGWAGAAQIVARIQAPKIPDRSVSITELGAVNGSDITRVVAEAIARIGAQGGGRVVIPAGRWISGPIHLKSHIELHVAEGAVVEFKTNPAAYLPAVFTRWEGMECWNYSALIYALDQTDVAITGKGTLDGGASEENWWAWKKTQRADRDRLFAQAEAGVPVDQRRFGEGSLLRPNFVQFYRCERVKVEGVTFKRSPMWILHPVLCTNVTVRGVSIISHGPNSDGCDPESSSDVLIEDCLFDTGDDCIAIKSGRNNDGRRLNVPSENIVIRRSQMRDGHGGVVIGSEISGGARNIFAEDNVMDSPNLDRALRIKSNASRGGVIENIYFRNTSIGKVNEAVLTVDFLYEEGAKGAFPPAVRSILIENVTSTESPRVLYLAGFPGAVIDGVVVRDSVFSGLTQPDLIQSAGRVVFERVNAVSAQRPKSLNSVPSPQKQ